MSPRRARVRSSAAAAAATPLLFALLGRAAPSAEAPTCSAGQEPCAELEVAAALQDEEAAGEASASALSLRQLRGQQHPQQWALQPEALTRSTGGPGPSSGEEDLGEFHRRLTSEEDAPPGAEYHPWSEDLAQPSTAPTFEFYMYRAMNGQGYAPLNINAASLGGVLWYLHHEVVVQYPRKFNIDRIERYKVKVKATNPLINLGMHFGPRVAFDRGQCTGPMVCGRLQPLGPEPQPDFCPGAFEANKESQILPPSGKRYRGAYEWGKFGYHVGCNKLGDYPFPMYPVYYPNAVWYSLPGKCPSRTFDEKDPECIAEEPGGLCDEPTGQGNCTWNYERMGCVMLEDVVDTPVETLHKQGGREYNPFTDVGIKTTFWDGIDNVTANERRVARLRKVFAEKYPNQTLDEDLPTPPCDFDYGAFYREFWWKAPFGGKCQDAAPTSKCYGMAEWGKKEGVVKHPDWYPGLSANSTFAEFQQLFYMQGKADCPYRPCSIEPMIS